MKRLCSLLVVLCVVLAIIPIMTASADTASYAENILFKETFDHSGYKNDTAYYGRTGAWGGSNTTSISQNNDTTNDGVRTAEDGRIVVGRGVSAAPELKFIFSENISDAKLLKVTTSFDGGNTANGHHLRIDLASGTAEKMTICRCYGGHIYVNTTGTDAAYDTGATYTTGNYYKLTAIIDEDNEQLKLWIYDATAGAYVLKDYTAPYEHKSKRADAWNKVKSGFQEVDITMYRNSSAAGNPFQVYDISVSELEDYDGNLFKETFSSNSYDQTTTYNGKTGAWSNADPSSSGVTLDVNQNDGEGKIYSKQSSGAAKVFTFDEKYDGAMLLKVTADILTGKSTNGSESRIDIFSDNDQRMTICRFIGGTIYANTMGSEAAYSTGATYQYEHRHTVTAIIDEENETFRLSVHDDTADTDVLTDYLVPNYKHNKNNWLKMTSGFKGIYYYSYRNSSGTAESLYSISVTRIGVEYEDFSAQYSDGRAIGTTLGSNKTVNTSVYAKSAKTMDMMLATALYDADGNLDGINVSQQALTGGADYQKVTSSVTLPSGDLTGYSVKAFLWDASDYFPYAKALNFN